MANLPPQLRVSGLPDHDPTAATNSPARGAEMRDFLQSRLQKNRAPPLVHSWDFYHDRQAAAAAAADSGGGDDAKTAPYAQRLEHLAAISDVRQFWSVFNNFDIGALALRDSIHLFHRGVQPVWEDARNAQGGAWTFRVPKSLAPEFWKELCLMAIGEQLQAAVEDAARTSFRDDICGISLSVRFNSVLVQVWNRDGEHEEGRRKVLDVVLGGVSDGMRPREGSYYYKMHKEHAAFTAKE